MSSPALDTHSLALRQISRRFGHHPGWSTLIIVAGVLQTVATILFAALLAHVLHALIIVGQPFEQLESVWWQILACIVFRALAGIVREEGGIRISLAVRGAVRETLLDTLYRLGPAWRERQQAGSLSTALLEQVEALDGYFARYRPQQWFALLTPLMIIATLAPSSWAAAGILLLTAPLIPVFMILVGWGARQRQTEQLQALQRMSGHFLDLIRGLPTLRLLDAHLRLADEVEQVGDEFRWRTMRVLRLAFLSGAVLEFFASIAIALSAVYFGLTLLGRLDFGLYGHPLDLELALFALLLAPEFYQPLRDLGTHYHARAEALAAAGELQTILNAASLQPAGGDTRIGNGAPALTLDRITFGHREGETVLRKCSLQIQAGDAVAIRGPSGGGKTTLLRLLLGQLRAQEGDVLIGGLSIDDIDLVAWRERVAWMSQHPRLMADTLAANLRVARSDASEAELREALTFAGLGTWFAELRDGLATPLGEGGRQLSGGQLRRLALARVRLRRADVLLLDEPTASLDAETEEAVIERIAELRRGRTLVLLTHRAAPLRIVDRVLDLENGRLCAPRDEAEDMTKHTNAWIAA
ncbi:thiol reductant ABC exporter subunit CydD [Propionivibrio sp.]|uniref:thiol reductant ABC exporter subunit CydD n=1 Tax=Propionivibrio sp. TaxID=2212460 RepID=UPI00272DD5C2|nr:thiol reductant ABC exporter subunit CydD [Propionivibrio sp.]